MLTPASLTGHGWNTHISGSLPWKHVSRKAELRCLCKSLQPHQTTLQTAYCSKQPNFKHLKFLFPTLNEFLLDCSQSWNETEQLWRIMQTLLTVASTIPWFHTAVRVFGLQPTAVVRTGELPLHWWHPSESWKHTASAGDMAWEWSSESRRETQGRGEGAACARAGLQRVLVRYRTHSTSFPSDCVRSQVGVCLVIPNSAIRKSWQSLTCTALFLSSFICLFPFQLSSEQGKGQSISSFNNCFSIHYTLLSSILPLTSPQMKKITLIFKYVLSVWHYTYPTHYLLSSLLLFLFFSPDTLPREWGLCTQLWAKTSTVYVRDHSTGCHKPSV